ncbi:MAG: hypothetical protein ACE5EB_02130, partial [Thermodesulfobacteriota bacterium]
RRLRGRRCYKRILLAFYWLRPCSLPAPPLQENGYFHGEASRVKVKKIFVLQDTPLKENGSFKEGSLVGESKKTFLPGFFRRPILKGWSLA